MFIRIFMFKYFILSLKSMYYLQFKHSQFLNVIKLEAIHFIVLFANS